MTRHRRLYLRGLVRHSHTLPFGVWILKVLGKLTALHPDQMAPVLCAYTRNRFRIPLTRTNAQRLSHFSLTILVLVVGAPADHLCHMLCLLVNGRGPQDGAWWRLLADEHFHRTGLGELAVELVEALGVLREGKHVESGERVEPKAENFSFSLQNNPKLNNKCFKWAGTDLPSWKTNYLAQVRI